MFQCIPIGLIHDFIRRERFPRHRGLAIPTCIMARVWRACRDPCLTSGFRWSWWRGKRSRHSQRMRNPQFYVSGKRPIEFVTPLYAYWYSIFPVTTHRSWTHCGLLTLYGHMECGHHWLRQWFAAFSAPGYYLNKYGRIVNRTLRSSETWAKLRNVCIQENKKIVNECHIFWNVLFMVPRIHRDSNKWLQNMLQHSRIHYKQSEWVNVT